MTMNELANDFNRRSFEFEHGRLPINDYELIEWVLLIVKEVKSNKKAYSAATE